MTIIHKDFTFLSSIHFEGKFMVNLFEMSATMTVHTENVADQNIAIQRMQYFISEQIEDCIFINEKEKDAIEKYQELNIKTCVIPEEPYDQIVGLILINKCNAIMEGKIIVEEIVFGSKLSNQIKFNISSEEAIVEYPEKIWYNDPTLSISNKKKKGKIVPLFGSNTWAELNLTYQEK